MVVRGSINTLGPLANLSLSSDGEDGTTAITAEGEEMEIPGLVVTGPLAFHALEDTLVTNWLKVI